MHLEAGLPPDWQARLAVIGGETLTEALRLSKAETVTIMRIRDEIGSTATPAALGWKFGAQVAQAVVLARAAVLEAPLPIGWQSEIARGAGAALPVTAADLMPALQGPDLGKRLREIEARWLASDLYLGKAALLA